MAEFGHINETGEILEIRAFVVELAEGVVLRDIALAQRLERLGIISPWAKLDDIPNDEVVYTHCGTWRASCW